MKKLLGKTREERVQKRAALKQWKQDHEAKVDAGLLQDQELGTGTPLEHIEQRKENAKARRKLGFIDLETDENGKTILAEDGIGVSDRVMEELTINKTKYDKQVQEQRARKKIDIVTPVQGISRQEYQKGMLRSDEYFKDV